MSSRVRSTSDAAAECWRRSWEIPSVRKGLLDDVRHVDSG
jgi:hypothetical protein